MYVVIFKAVIKSLDENYYQTAAKMRELALSDHGCIRVDSVGDADQEITLSYWNNEEDILAWKNNPEHLKAQRDGMNKWYESCSVEIAQLGRSYSL